MSCPWSSWWQTDLPCEFTQEEARTNCEFLTEILGEAWLDKAPTVPAASNHPLLAKWITKGAGSFLQLNGLAEDIRVVKDRPGFDTVLHDLKNALSTDSAGHVIHGAALFERHAPGSVIQFFPQTSDSIPDFLVRAGGADLAAEAKLLTRSEAEESFEAYGQSLVDHVLANVSKENTINPAVYIVIKQAEHRPSLGHVGSVLERAIASHQQGTAITREDQFNIVVEPPPQDASGLKGYRHCCVFSPRSADEDLRVEQRGKKASKQLRAFDEGRAAGLFLLGVTPLNDPHVIKRLLDRKFRAGLFHGISGAMLIWTGTHMDKPRRSILDLIGVVQNTQNPRQGTKDFGIKPLGLSGNLFAARPPGADIPAYRVCTVEGTASSPGAQLFLRNIRVLTEELLR